MKKQMIMLAALLLSTFGSAQLVIPLWEQGKMPNSKGLQMTDSISNSR